MSHLSKSESRGFFSLASYGSGKCSVIQISMSVHDWGFFSLCFSILHPLTQYLLDLMAICPPTSIQKIREPHFSGDHYAPLASFWLSPSIVIGSEDEVKHL